MLSYISTGSHDENDQIIVQSQPYGTKRHLIPLASPSKHSHGAPLSSKVDSSSPSKVVEFSFHSVSPPFTPYDFLRRLQAEVGRVQRAAAVQQPSPPSTFQEGGSGTSWLIRVQFYTVSAAIRACNMIRSAAAPTTAALVQHSRESSATKPTEEAQKAEKSQEDASARLALLINPTTIKESKGDPVDTRYLPFFMLNEGELLMDVSKIDSYGVSEESVIEHISDVLGEFNLEEHNASDPIEVPHVSRKPYLSDVHVPAQSSASSSSSTRLITTENQFKSGRSPQQGLHRSSSEDLGSSEDSLSVLLSAYSLNASDAIVFPTHHHTHHIHPRNNENNSASAASKEIETSCPKINSIEGRALQAHFPDRAGILNNHCPSILPTRAVLSGTCSDDITASSGVGRLSSFLGDPPRHRHYHHLKSAIASSSDSDPTNDSEPMSAAISRLLLNNPNKFRYDDDDDIDLTFGIAHLNLDLNTPIAPRSNAPWMADNVHGFSSEGAMAPSTSWGKREEALRDDSLNGLGSYSYFSSPQPAWAGHKRRYTTGIQPFLPAATYVPDAQSPPSFSRASSDGYRHGTPFGLRGLYDSGSEAELGPVPPHIVAAQQQLQQEQYYRSRQASLSIPSGEPFFNSPERNPGLSAYVPGGKSYSDHGYHPHHRTTASGPNPSRLTNEGVYGSLEGLYPNANVNNTRPGHRSSLSQSSTTSTSRHSDSHSQKSSALSTASSSPPQPAPNRLHGTNTNNNNNGKKSVTPNKDQDADGSKKKGKPRQDKRLYAADPHQGPRPTDWMLSEETLRSRTARDARFAQIVAMGLTKGRTKAGWAQARRPGKRDRDAAKRKLREMEEEEERERLKALLDEGKPELVSTA
ncbi:hypothetical protein CPB86DRAFT_874785 [Serendipita vermifera]|nr:hypothetical protein CPB86DRAFT_874785 [Serendipita vermifera]